MVQVGFGQFSVRKVARAAGVSMGHLQHYFPRRGDLLRALLISLERDFLSNYKREIAPIPNPVERFVACARYVIDRSGDEHMVPLLREFWAMAARDDAVAGMLDDFYNGCRRLAASILLEANAELDTTIAMQRAAAAVSLLSGAFLYLDGWSEGEAVPGFRDYVLDTIASLPYGGYGDSAASA